MTPTYLSGFLHSINMKNMFSIGTFTTLTSYNTYFHKRSYENENKLIFYKYKGLVSIKF